MSSNSAQATPVAADTNVYSPISIPGDPNAASGVFDPSIVSSTSGTVWLAYSSVHYYSNGAAALVQDVSTSIAGGLPAPILTLPTPGERFGRACSWDRGLRTTGILIDDLDTSANPPFRIQATHKAL